MRLITFLYVTNFCTGAIVMVLELLGTRFMAPFFGTGLYVWTALITVTLVSLALGYRAGGYAADRLPRADALYGIIFASGVLLLLILLVRMPILEAGARLSLAWGALVASSILFGPPLFLLGMVAPFSVKLCALELEHLGNVVGRLYAISTLGSFVGTVCAGFLLLPNFNNVATLLACAVLLAVLPAVYFAFYRRSLLPGAGAALVLAIALYAHHAIAAPLSGTMANTSYKYETLFQTNGFYGGIKIVDLTSPDVPHWRQRYLLNDGLTQGSYEPIRKVPVAPFPYALCDLVLPHKPDLRRVLVLGLGGGFVPSMLKALIAKPGDDPARVRADFVIVEINPTMVDVAARYFDFSPGDFTLVIEDARTWVSSYKVGAATPCFDAIIVDTFLGDNTPSHLLSREMFAELRRILAPDGALAMNVFGSIRGESSRLIAALVKTLTCSDGAPPLFPHVQIFSPEATTTAHNVYLLASGDPAKKRPNGVLRVAVPQFAENEALGRSHAKVSDSLQDQTAHLADVQHAPLLTDDFAVADHLDIPVKEDIRRNILEFWRDVLAE